MSLVKLFWEQFGEPCPEGTLAKQLASGTWKWAGEFDRLLVELEDEHVLVKRLRDRRTLVWFPSEEWNALGPSGQAWWDARAARVGVDMEKLMQGTRIEPGATTRTVRARIRALKRKKKMSAEQLERRARLRDGRRREAEKKGYFDTSDVVTGAEPGDGGTCKAQVGPETFVEELARKSEAMIEVHAPRAELWKEFSDGETARDRIRKSAPVGEESDGFFGREGGSALGEGTSVDEGGGEASRPQGNGKPLGEK